MTSYPNCLSLKSGKGEIFKLLYIENLDFRSQFFNSMSETFLISCSNCYFALKTEHLIFYLSADSDTLSEIQLKDQIWQ